MFDIGKFDKHFFRKVSFKCGRCDDVTNEQSKIFHVRNDSYFIKKNVPYIFFINFLVELFFSEIIDH